MVSDLDIYRSAKIWLDRHSDQAVPLARGRVAELQALGDRAGADTWLRIIAVIEALRAGAEPGGRDPEAR